MTKKFLERKKIKAVVRNIYFSDHDAIEIQIYRENRQESDEEIDFTINEQYFNIRL